MSTETASTDQHVARHGRRVGLRRVALRIAKWAGTFAIVAVLALAVIAHLGVVNVHVVTSGSMQPALRAGDMIVAQPAPAETAEVGDVVTLRHPDGKLVTHRVLENEPDPNGPGRLISMQGDDNAVADPEPYPVETVDTTLIRIPLLGGTMQALAQPPVSYIAIGSLALLVIASLMPRRQSRTQET